MKVTHNTILQILFLLILLHTSVNSSSIIPNDSNSISISFPTTSQFGAVNTQFNINFYLPGRNHYFTGLPQPNSQGWVYNQYIGVSFPSWHDKKIFTDPNYFTCELSYLNSLTGLEVKLQSSSHISEDMNEANIVYCRQDSPRFDIVEAGQTIRLKVTFNSDINAYFTKKIEQVSVFISSSTDRNRFIFDAIPLFASIAIKERSMTNQVATFDWNTSETPWYTNRRTNILWTVNFRTWLAWSDYSFVFTYDPSCYRVDAQTKVELLKVSDTDPNPPTGEFIAYDFGTNGSNRAYGAEFSHYGEVFTNERFVIGFMNVILNSTPVEECHTEVTLYRKNTNSIVGTTRKNFEIISSKINLKVSHPDNIDRSDLEYFSGGAFPIKFGIELDPTTSPSFTLSNVYLVIKHSNFSVNNNTKITFIATTCDWSSFPGIASQAFGVRPNCYPWNIAYNINDNIGTDDGSGIIVYINGYLRVGETHELIVWAFFDECGAKTSSGYLNDPTIYYKRIEFTAAIYDKIYTDQFGPKRLPKDPIAKSADGGSNFVSCLNAFYGAWDSDGYHFDSNDIVSTSNSSDKLFYREYFNWELFDWNGSLSSVPSLVSVGITNESSNKAYFYKDNTNISSVKLKNGNSILLRVKEERNTWNRIQTTYPLGLRDINGAPASDENHLVIKYSSNFVEQSKISPCTAFWTFNQGTNRWSPVNCTTNNKCNWIGEANANSPSTIPGNTAKAFPNYLISTNADNDSKFSFGFPGDANTVLNGIFIYFGFADNCHSFKNIDSPIKSIYTSFDIIIALKPVFDNTEQITKYNRVMRLIKLFPEGGVFNELADYKFGNGAGTATPWFTNHFVYQESSKKPENTLNGINGVCLLEIKNTILSHQAPASQDYNTIILWLFLGSWIETDYTKASAYPVGNIGTGVTMYGWTSQHTWGNNNFHSVKSTSKPSPINYFYTKFTSNPASATYNSSYHFFMGSMLIFTRVSNSRLYNDPLKPLLIPYYCPQLTEVENTKFPAMIGMFINGSSNTNWSNEGVKGYMSTSGRNIIFTSNGGIKTIGSEYAKTTVRFNSLLNRSVNWIEIYSGVNGICDSIYPCKTQKCDAHMILFNSSVMNGSTTLISPDSTDAKAYQYYIPFGTFYPYGKSFSGIYFYLDSSDKDITTQPFLSLPTAFKPTVMNYQLNANDHTWSSIDRVGYWCVSSSVGVNSYASNYFPDNHILLTDYSTDTKEWSVDNFKIIKKPPILNDPHVSASFTISFPSTLVTAPAGAVVYFTIDLTASVCGMETNGAHTNKSLIDCEKDANEYKCFLFEPCTKLNIHCYNLDMSIDQEWMVHKFRMELPNTPNDVDESHSLNIELLKDELTQIIFRSNEIDNFDVVEVTMINDRNITVNDGGIGKIYFEIDLKRDTPRFAEITLSSTDWHHWVIPGTHTRCYASFSKFYTYYGQVDPDAAASAAAAASTDSSDNGNGWFDSCVFDYTSTPNTIIVKTKNIAYKKDFVLPDKVYIHLWPVIVQDFSRSKYTINVTASSIPVSTTDPTYWPDYDSEAKTADLFFNVIKPTLKPHPKPIEAPVDLCNVVSINTRIPGEKAEYTFSIDLTNTLIQDQLNNVDLVNEITLFFPFPYYPGVFSTILCYDSEWDLLVCSYSTDYILNIKFNTSLQPGNNVQITLSGITNPYINRPATDNDVVDEEDIIFACSLNKYDNMSNMSRHTVIYGIGKILPLFRLPTIEGGLIFYKLPNLEPAISSDISRDIVKHTFRIGFDTAADYTTAPLVDNPIVRPTLYIDFPYGYALYRDDVNEITVSITEYSYDRDDANTNNQHPIPSETSLTMVQTIYGNRIQLVIEENIPTIPNMIFLEIVITNVSLPKDPNILNNSFTGPYSFILTDETNDKHYITTVTSNNFCSDYKGSFLSFANTKWYRGNYISLGEDSKNEDAIVKWFIDVASETTDNNNWSIQPGRYFKAHFKLKNNKNSLSASTNIWWDPSETVFSTTEESYSIKSSRFDNEEFYIGCPCTTAPGMYYTKFLIDNIDKFTIANTVNVLVDIATKGTIDINFPTKIPINSSFWWLYYLSEPNVDSLLITWKKDDEDFVTVKIPPLSFTDQANKNSHVMSLFSFVDSSDVEMTFTSRNPNNCYEFNKVWLSRPVEDDSEKVYEFKWTPDKNIVQGPIPYVLVLAPPLLTFNTSETMPSIPHNSLMFYYTPHTSPAYMYCVLQCMDLPIPTIEQMRFTNLEEYIALGKRNSIYRKHFSTFIHYQDAPETVNMFFEDWVRGWNYRLICVLESADADQSTRKIVQGIMSGNISNRDFITTTPTLPLQSMCVTLSFTSPLTNENKLKLVDLCQRHFSTMNNKGFYNNGCVICSDINQYEKGEGMEYTSQTCSMKSRLLSTSSRADTLPISDDNIFSVCAMVDANCATDPQPLNFRTQFTNLAKTIQTSLNLLQFHNVSDINVNHSVAPVWSSDTSINSAWIKIEISSWNINGSIKYKAYYDGDNSWGCYFKVAKDSEPVPTLSQIRLCAINDSHICGGIIVLSSITKDVEREIRDLMFDYKTKYVLYLGCRNLNPDSRFYSAVVGGTWVSDNPPELCPDGTTYTYPVCWSGGYVKVMSYYLFVLILLGLIVG